MGKMVVLLCLLLGLAFSGCSTGQEGSGGNWGASSDHQGHHH